jgi:hypothetical protein
MLDFEAGSQNSLQSIIREALDTGEVPADWRTANVSPVYKKGLKSAAENYRLISLTLNCRLSMLDFEAGSQNSLPSIIREKIPMLSLRLCFMYGYNKNHGPSLYTTKLTGME